MFCFSVRTRSKSSYNQNVSRSNMIHFSYAGFHLYNMIYFFIATVFLLPTVYFDIRPSHPTPDLNGSCFSVSSPLFVSSSSLSSHVTSVTQAHRGPLERPRWSKRPAHTGKNVPKGHFHCGARTSAERIGLFPRL